MRPLRALILSVMVVALPRALRAQGSFVEQIFKSLDDVGAFWVYQGFLPTSSTLTAGNSGAQPKQSGLQGPGLGFTFHLTDVTTCVHRKPREGPRRSPQSDTAQGAQPDTAHHQCPADFELDQPWRFELALIYSQVSGFHSQDPSFDLRGSIRELPRLSWFVLYKPGRLFSPYFGFHVGLLQTQSVAIYDTTGAYYPMSGTTYELGVAVGGALLITSGSEAMQIFVEPGYTMRSFSSFDWGGGVRTIPARFPRTLRFTGWEVAVGVEIAKPQQREAGGGAKPGGSPGS